MTLPDNAELPNSSGARVEATKRVGALLQQNPDQLWSDKDWQMDVTDETGLILYVIQVVASNSAATMMEAGVSAND